MNVLPRNSAPYLIAGVIFAAVFFASLRMTSLLPLILVLGAAVAAAVGYIGFKKPWLMVILIGAGSYMGSLFYFAEDFFLPITLFQLFLMAALLLFVLNRLYTNSFSIDYTGYEIPVLAFLALIFLSLIYSPDRESGLFNVFRFMVLLLLVGYVLNTVYSIRIVSAVVVTLSGIAVLLSGYAITEIILNPQIAIQNLTGAQFGIRRASAGGLYHDPNRFAAILFLPIAFTFSVINSDLDKKYRIISAAVFLVLVGGLFSTFSRSGFLSVIVILLIVVGLYKNWKMAGLFGAAGLAIVLAVPELRDAFILNVERVIDVFFGTRDDSSGIRVMLGLAGLQMFIDSYMIGVGFDGFSEKFTNYYSLQQSIGVNEPHNITYTIMAELGLIGLLFYLYYLYVMAYHSIKNVRLSVSSMDKVISSTLLATYASYLLFYQFYGGALLDSNFMLVHALIFVVYFQLLKKNREN